MRFELPLYFVRFQPLDHSRNVLGRIVPVLARMPLHRHAHHSVFGGPAADIVVKCVGFAILLLNFVARAAGNINEDRPIAAAFVRREDVDQIFGVRTEGNVARDGDSPISGRDVAAVIVFRHQRTVELGCTRRVHDLPDLDESSFDIRRHLREGHGSGEKHGAKW
jgi:hypothetical protein